MNNRTTSAGTAARHELAAIFAKAVLSLICEGKNREETAQIDEIKLDKPPLERLYIATSNHGG